MEPLLWSSFLSPNGTLVPVVDFANSVIIGTQIYGRLRNLSIYQFRSTLQS